jgi:hypothetical protein
VPARIIGTGPEIFLGLFLIPISELAQTPKNTPTPAIQSPTPTGDAHENIDDIFIVLLIV